ncbi:AAA family ATPase [Phytopseudomonas dryadis]|uniref:Recombinase RecF n=1 Tax=Phytopseudomonas dryadis TaxID=2487520 RepID=A0ABY1Z5G6_9GAMM|nr:MULTISPECIES: AAA family ATPase [Pseudomonas]TBV05091.1 recombinase RecF [Pseudomonas dryadis]TBV16493.1 recombinase RecF [Pseudomonas sp. FRB 230]
MSKKNRISKLSIDGFKSIRSLPDFELGNLNVLLGANGAGKSSFVSYFRMLGEMVEGRLQKWAVQQGGADRILSFGIKETNRVESFIRFGLNGYRFALEPTVDGGFVFANERLFFAGPYYGDKWIELGNGHQEAKLKEQFLAWPSGSEADYCYSSISSWKVFHFHDTSDTAGVKRWGGLQDNDYLRPDASNLASYLFRLQEDEPEVYEQIRKTVQLAIPFFDDFALKPRKLKGDDEQIRLLWRQKDSDYTFWPSQLSDGSIRFICLVTALLQPDPPSTIIIDEPELGLHPYAITLLASLLRSASTRMQVIVSTQSVPLVDEFTVDDLIIVEREQGDTVFKRLDEEELKTWLEDYTLGELWEKNILGGRPRK